MHKKEIILSIEDYVKKTMAPVKDEAHGYRHVDRVRRWAVKLGRAEGGVNLFLLEVAALLHDIGRVRERRGLDHYRAGERMVRAYLKRLGGFKPAEIELVARAVYEHGPGGNSQFSKILRDADRIDMLGAVIVARAFAHYRDKPYYIDRKSFALKKWKEREVNRHWQEKPWERSVVDNLVYDLSTYARLETKSARKLAKVKADFLKLYLKRLEREIFSI